jgi:hypothetical protein
MYFEISKDYSALNINLNSVLKANKLMRVDAPLPETQGKVFGSLTWDRIKNKFKGGVASPGVWATAPSDRPYDDKDSLAFASIQRDREKQKYDQEIMYEVVVRWSWLDGDYIKESVVTSHAMTMEDALKEKQDIVDCIYKKGPIVETIDKMLKDPTSVAVGFLGDECERRIAQLIQAHIIEANKKLG